MKTSISQLGEQKNIGLTSLGSYFVTSLEVRQIVSLTKVYDVINIETLPHMVRKAINGT